MIIFDVLLVSVSVIIVKIDLILGELKCNLRSFKVIYFLVKNLKKKHKWNRLNYNRLVLSTRIFHQWNEINWWNHWNQFSMMDYSGVVTLVLIIVFNTTMSIWSRKFIWIIWTIQLTILLNSSCYVIDIDVIRLRFGFLL